MPSARPVDRNRLLRASAVWLCLVAAIAILTRYDVAVAAWVRRFPDLAKHGAVDAARLLGESWAILGAIVVAIILAERRRPARDRRAGVIIAHWLLALYLGFNVAQAGKITIVRERPYATFERFPGNTPPVGSSWLGVELDLRRKATLESFPSGHSTTAFAGAATLAWFYPRLRVALFALAAACAASRVVQFAHWPSDCLAGSAIGWASAWGSLRIRALTTPRRWFRRRPGPPQAQGV